MRLIVLYGLPATGKLTVAQHLAALTGYKLFHNHLAVDLLLSTFDFGSPPFITLREAIWLSVFRQAAVARLPALIFTFNPESTVRPGFIPELIATVSTHSGEVLFVELTCPLELLKQRLADPSRHAYRKLTSLTLFEGLYSGGAFNTFPMPPPALTLDTSLYSPAQAAALIAEALHLSQTV